MNKYFNLIDKLKNTHTLSLNEYEALIENFSPELLKYASEKANQVRHKVYGNQVFIRGLIEVGNVCRNDCYYCGIRKSNKNIDRYTLSKREVLECCENGYALGFRTFVLQSGEGALSVGFVCDTIKDIKTTYPDCAVTLSLGEYSFSDYKKMRDAGADRYLLRHETADKEHYEKLHPKNMSFENRMDALKNLKALGFQVGCGFMVGSPFQTPKTLAKDLKFIETFSPEMCGVGPYITHKDTPFNNYKSGSVELTLFMLSIIRLIKPNVLLPATTALSSSKNDGREQGIMAGANVVMPNLSPKAVRDKYALYDGKLSSNLESAQNVLNLKESLKSIGYEVVTSRGDIKI